MKDNYSPKVSVIVPVWNPGSGISRCIESLRNQTLKEIEMIFVDDCGTDDSMDKVRAVAADDSRIRIIENEENIGAGPSRNKGIELAQGEYLSFVDPDDYVAPDFLELLYKATRTHSFDIVKGTIICKREDGTVIHSNENHNNRIRKDTKSGKPLYLLFTSGHQSAIYKKETIISTDSRYGSSRRGQDTTFLLQVCTKAKTISTLDEAHYFLCEREGSATHILNKSRLEGSLQSTIDKVEYVLHNLMLDSWSNEYLQERFLYAIREGYRYVNSSDLGEALCKYTACLQSELLRLPSREYLIERSYSIRALYDHAYLLPRAPHHYPWEDSNPPIRYAKLAKRWVDYYTNYPEERTICARDLLLLLSCANRAVHYKPATYSTEELMQGKTILKEQIKRLPLNMRISLVLIVAKNRIAKSLPTSARESIKRLLGA